MKIAIVAPPFLPIPPLRYGGIERAVDYLMRGLVELGHEVTLFAPADSIVSCRLIPIVSEHLFAHRTKFALKELERLDRATFVKVQEYQDNFDVIHWQGRVFEALDSLRTPVLYTFHGYISPKDNAALKTLRRFKHVAFTGLSKDFLAHYPQIDFAGFVYNGLPVDEFPFSEKPKDQVCFIGRFSPEKQPHLAMEAAIAMGKKIVIGAKLFNSEKKYFEKYCKKLLSHPLVDFRGEVTDEEKKQIFAQSLVNLHPIAFDEPFGLAVVEAALCGTPTIAFNRGSMREVIKSNVSGMLVKNILNMRKAIADITHLDRKNVRAFAQQFSYIRMAQEYAKLYRSMAVKKRTEEVKGSSLYPFSL